MFSKIKIAAIAVIALLTSVFSAVNAETFAGMRSSYYGFNDGNNFPTPQEAANAIQNIAAKFNATPSAVWIIGGIKSGGVCELEFPKPNDGKSYANITFQGYDKHEAYLNEFDKIGAKVFLQVEPGLASMEDLIDICLKKYGDHPSVIGFGLDVEWYPSTGTTNSSDEGYRTPLKNDKLKSLVNKVKSYNSNNKNYKVMAKHWETDFVGGKPVVNDVIYFNSSQDFNWGPKYGMTQLEAMTGEFKDWADYFSPNALGFQIGYAADRNWWNSMSDPIGEIGKALKNSIKNQDVHIFWTDETIRDSKFSDLWKAPDGKFDVVVNGGTVLGGTRQSLNATVSITASVPAGKKFKSWTSSDVTFANAASAATTFKMPGKAVVITANFEVIDPDLIDENDLVYWEGWEANGEDGSWNLNGTDNANGLVKFSMQTNADDGKNHWPWADVATYFNPGDFNDVTSIVITYTSDADMNFVLVDNQGMAEEGKGFTYELENTNGIQKTLTLNPTQFYRIDGNWQPTIQMRNSDKQYIEGVSFGIGSSSDISGTITKLLVNGLKIASPVYSITYHLNNGINNPQNPKEYTAEMNTIILKDATRTGYNFEGWYENASFSGSKITEIEKGSTGNKSFYAKWSFIKLDPEPTIPTNLTAVLGQTLADVGLPEGFSWKNPRNSVGTVGEQTHKAIYTPTDINTYNIIEVDIKIQVYDPVNVGEYKLSVGAVNYNYDEGETVTLIASEYVQSESRGCYGIRFSHWEFDTDVRFVDGTNEESEVVRFIMPARDVVVNAEETIYTLSSVLSFGVIGENGILTAVDNGGNEIISGNDAVCGDYYTFTATPANGYKVKDWYCDNCEIISSENNVCIIEIFSGDAEVTVEFEPDGTTPIIDTEKIDKFYGIKIMQNPVSDKAEIFVNAEFGIRKRSNDLGSHAELTVYDMVGNIVYTCKGTACLARYNTSSDKTTIVLIWDLRNNAGRIVANGSYLVVVEAESITGQRYRYSTKLGVKR